MVEKKSQVPCQPDAAREDAIQACEQGEVYYLSQQVGGQVLVNAESSSLLGDARQPNGGGDVQL